MQGEELLLPQQIYTENLAVIGGISFTQREIDIIACLLNARKTRKVAFILSISPNTVLVHVRNILLKIDGNSREGIIDFIEKSHKGPFLREYYTSLMIYSAFERSLKDVSRLKKDKTKACLVFCGEAHSYRKTLIPSLENHLKQAGIHINILEMGEAFKKEEIKKDRPLFLIVEKKDINKAPKEFLDFNFIDFSEQKSYYLLVFEILKKLLPNVDVGTIFKNFFQQYDGMQFSLEVKHSQSYNEEKLGKNGKKTIYKDIEVQKNKKWAIVFIAFCLCLFCLSPLFLKGTKEMQVGQDYKKSKEFFIRSDLTIPTESVLLDRPEKMVQIEKKFKGKSGIQAIALVGPGGAGKTILARQYARQLDVPLIWELNAETYENLKYSFESLARNLAKTEEDQKAFRELQEIKDSREREEVLIKFVKERLKTYSYWCLLYDNLESFAEIQNYFPQDVDTWGEGKIILTTRNSHIQHNILFNGIIQVGELNADQKLNLFIKIMTNGNARSFTVVQTEEAKRFLEQISPYPLDISVAAYYLKTIPIPYAVYLENLVQNDKNFTSVQENLLKEAGPYKKTRYSIISLSLK